MIIAKTRTLLASMGFGAVIAASTIAGAPPAHAQWDPRIPIPVLTWCPGGGGGSGWGGYCEGINFPDGTRLNFFRVMGYWQGPRCIRPNGTPDPIPAPGGCGGLG